MNTKLNLAGSWEFKLDGEKRGINEGYENTVFEDTIILPNTTSYAKKGPSNRARETYFLTDVYKFEGYAWYRKTLELPVKKSEIDKKHYFLTLERTRISTVWVDGVKVGTLNSFIAKHVYDLTPYIKTTKPVLTVMVSNTDYVANGGHMTSDDTQTNWNGILGEISLEICDQVRISHITTTTDYAAKQIKVYVKADALTKTASKGKISVATDLIRLKPGLLKEDGDISLWEKRATSQQAQATDPELLDTYLEVEKDTIPVVNGEIGLHKYENTELCNVNTCKNGLHKFDKEDCIVLQLPKDAKEWDDEEPWVYRIKVTAEGAEKTVYAALRDFKSVTSKESGAHFAINGRRTFLRGRHNGMIFPLSGFAPMNVTGWLKDLKITKDWGINHERFHTCTPPEAAFLAADLLGIYLQPEIPFWGTWNGPKDEAYEANKEVQEFLTREGFNIINEFAGHPSFVMMSMGNELWGDPQALNQLLGGYKEVRPDIMYTQGSNNFQWMPNIQPNDDFFSGVRFSIERQIRGSYAQCDAPLGHVQKSKPGTAWNYDEAICPSYCKEDGREKAKGTNKQGEIEIQYGTGVKKVKAEGAREELIPEIPVVSHEVGQYFMFPDFREISRYTGALQPRNLQVFQERLDDKSLYNRAKWYFFNSGFLAMDCYKEELEAALRSDRMSGFQLLDLQDYTGQGTALVGPLNGLMENKGLITTENWRKFCSANVLMGEFESYELTNGTKFSLAVKLAHFSKKPIKGAKLVVTFTDRSTGASCGECVSDVSEIKNTGLIDLGEYDIDVPEGKEPGSYELIIKLISGKKENVIADNQYTFWSYPAKITKVKVKNTIITDNLRDTMEAIDSGKPVLWYLSPEENHSGVPGAYCTDFWNYPMFKSISESMGKNVPVGTLGTIIAQSHPALAGFPCEGHTTPQWFDIIERAKMSNLKRIGFRPIVTVIDNCERNANLAMIYEFDVMDGKNGPCHLLVCTSPLPTLVKEGNKPAAALQNSLLKYLEGGEFITQLRTNASAIGNLTR